LEGRKKSFQFSKQTVYTHHKKTPKIYVGQKLDPITKPHKLFFFLQKLRNFPSKKFGNKLLSLFFSPPFFLLFFPFFLGEDEAAYYGVYNKYLLDFGSYFRS
jgi:hypothetical protein